MQPSSPPKIHSLYKRVYPHTGLQLCGLNHLVQFSAAFMQQILALKLFFMLVVDVMCHFIHIMMDRLLQPLCWIIECIKLNPHTRDKSSYTNKQTNKKNTSKRRTTVTKSSN